LLNLLVDTPLQSFVVADNSQKGSNWDMFQPLIPPAFDNFRISDIGKTGLQMGSGKQAPSHDGRDIFNACQVVDELLISNSHWQPPAEMTSMCHQP
jgi:hypothetical protein